MALPVLKRAAEPPAPTPILVAAVPDEPKTASFPDVGEVLYEAMPEPALLPVTAETERPGARAASSGGSQNRRRQGRVRAERPATSCFRGFSGTNSSRW